MAGRLIVQKLDQVVVVFVAEDYSQMVVVLKLVVVVPEVDIAKFECVVEVVEQAMRLQHHFHTGYLSMMLADQRMMIRKRVVVKVDVVGNPTFFDNK